MAKHSGIKVFYCHISGSGAVVNGGTSALRDTPSLILQTMKHVQLNQESEEFSRG